MYSTKLKTYLKDNNISYSYNIENSKCANAFMSNISQINNADAISKCIITNIDTSTPAQIITPTIKSNSTILTQLINQILLNSKNILIFFVGVLLCIIIFLLLL